MLFTIYFKVALKSYLILLKILSKKPEKFGNFQEIFSRFR